MTARVSMLKSRASLTCFQACFLPGRAKDLSALGIMDWNSMWSLLFSFLFSFSVHLDLNCQCHAKIYRYKIRWSYEGNWSSHYKKTSRVLEWTYNEHSHIRQHYLFIKTWAACFNPSLGHPRACGKLSLWCCVYIGIPICLTVVRIHKIW